MSMRVWWRLIISHLPYTPYHNTKQNRKVDIKKAKVVASMIINFGVPNRPLTGWQPAILISMQRHLVEK
jgi:hypothetical protein